MDVGNRDEVAKELDKVAVDLRRLQAMGDMQVRTMARTMLLLVKILRKAILDSKGAKR